MNATIIAISTTVFTFTVLTSQAKKPDWPGTLGMGTIGFGLIELTPSKKDGDFIPTTFTFTYDIPGKHAKNAASGQIIAMHASALAGFNDIPESEFLTHNMAETLQPSKGLHMSAQISVEKPGLYVVCYGPWTGLLTFDDAEARETYKISAIAPEGAQFRWVDQDAGDVTVARIQNDEMKKVEFIIRLRMLRAGLGVLDDKNNFRIEPLKLHPQAAERAKLLQANW